MKGQDASSALSPIFCFSIRPSMSAEEYFFSREVLTLPEDTSLERRVRG
jgi:hypothetical protein